MEEIGNTFTSLWSKISEVRESIFRPSDEEIARKLQAEENREVEKRRLEEEQLSQTYINQLITSGEIPNPVTHRSPQRPRLVIPDPSSPRNRSNSQPSLVLPSRTETHPSGYPGTHRTTRNPGEVRTLANPEDFNVVSARQLLMLIDDFQENPETKHRLLELLIAYQQHRAMAGSNPAKNLEGLPTFVWEGKTPHEGEKSEVEQTCSICLSDYEFGQVIKILPCMHKFHGQCIDMWLGEHNTCPVCKTKVDY